MASIGNVQLAIFEQGGSALVRVSYILSATHHDMAHEQSYRELVQLVGDDEGRGEDGRSETIPNSTIWDGIIRFTGNSQQFTQIHERTVPVSMLDEDGGPFIREDEIRARVTLTPVPDPVPTRVSNLVRRGAPVITQDR